MLTDNLAPFVRGPRKEDTAGFLAPLGLNLKEHDTLWGGAIQFVRADGTASPDDCLCVKVNAYSCCNPYGESLPQLYAHSSLHH